MCCLTQNGRDKPGLRRSICSCARCFSFSLMWPWRHKSVSTQPPTIDQSISPCSRRVVQIKEQGEGRVLDSLSIRSWFAKQLHNQWRPDIPIPCPPVQHYVRTAEIFNTHHASSVAEIPFAPTYLSTLLYTHLFLV
jgi:hypothetical protein